MNHSIQFQIPVYLDYNATTPCDPQVLEAMLPYFSNDFGNAASRQHTYGRKADHAVELAREQVAGLIQADPAEIVFTSGATEADNLALKGVIEKYASKGNHIITTVTEHKAVLDACRHLEQQGVAVTYLPVDENGTVNPADVEAAIDPATVLIAVMYANNETGVLQPVKEISAIARKHAVLFFSDATQATGKIPVHVQEDGIDLMAFSAHKMYGPKGVGALYVRRKNPRVQLSAQIDGGGHERDRRSGTLNVPGIVGFGKACQLSTELMAGEVERLKSLRDTFESAMLSIGQVYINGNTAARLPHVSNLAFKGAQSDAMLLALQQEIAVSAGSACMTATMEPSYVLKSMGLPDDLANASLRFSLGRYTSKEAMAFAIEKVQSAVQKLRSSSLSRQA